MTLALACLGSFVGGGVATMAAAFVVARRKLRALLHP